MNNAGVDGEGGITGESSIDNWKRVMSINIDGVYYGMKYVLPVMIEQRAGVILNTASTVGCNAIPGLARLHGIEGRRDPALEDHCDRVCRQAHPRQRDLPGRRRHATRTSAHRGLAGHREAVRRGFEMMNPIPGMVTTDAVASAALFLVSDEAAFITAVALPIDGGYTAR